MKVIGNVGQLRDMPVWFFISCEQLYWTGMTVLTWIYVFGMLNCVPVTEFKGYFAVYRHEFFNTPVYVLYLTSRQRNIFLAIGTIFPSIFALGSGVAAGVLERQGQIQTADVLNTVPWFSWCALLWLQAAVGGYYGIKFATVLRSYIVMHEAKLGVPPKPFGIKDLNSASSPRYLLIMSRITIFGGAAVFLLAASLCALWAMRRNYIRRAEDERWPHLLAVTWTCANAATFLVKLTLLAFHFRRSKRRGPIDATMYPAPQRSSILLTSRQSRTELPAMVLPDSHILKSSEQDQTFYYSGSSTDKSSARYMHRVSLESDRAQSSLGEQYVPSAEAHQFAMQDRTTATIRSPDAVWHKSIVRDRVSRDGARSDWSHSAGLPESASLHVPLEREREVEEFQALWQIYRSAVRLLERLQNQYRNEEPPQRQMQHLHASSQQLEVMCVHLRQLYVSFYENHRSTAEVSEEE